jgi:hypothetical protein
MKQHREPDRTPPTGHLGSQVQQYGSWRATLPVALIECAAVYGPEWLNPWSNSPNPGAMRWRAFLPNDWE